MTNEEKSELRNMIYRLQTVGYSKEWIINNIEKRTGFKKATIRKYYKSLIEAKES